MKKTNSRYDGKQSRYIPFLPSPEVNSLGKFSYKNIPIIPNIPKYSNYSKYSKIFQLFQIVQNISITKNITSRLSQLSTGWASKESNTLKTMAVVRESFNAYKIFYRKKYNRSFSQQQKQTKIL